MASPLMQALTIAQKVVETKGDENWFNQQYTLLRKNNNIAESMETALILQDLWGYFEDECGPELIKQVFG